MTNPLYSAIRPSLALLALGFALVCAAGAVEAPPAPQPDKPAEADTTRRPPAGTASDEDAAEGGDTAAQVDGTGSAEPSAEGEAPAATTLEEPPAGVSDQAALETGVEVDDPAAVDAADGAAEAADATAADQPADDVAAEAPAEPPAAVSEADSEELTASDETMVPAPAAITAAELPTQEQIEQALAEQYQQHMEAQRYADAIEVARSALEVKSLGRQPGDLVLAEPFLQLAQAQAASGEYQDATQNYLRCIEILELQEGPFSDRLIDPLTGLGETYHRAGLYPQAISALETAIHITRRNSGLFNLEQQDMLAELADSYVMLGQYEDADREQRYALRAAEKTFGEDDPRVVGSLQRLARWYRDTEQYPVERTYLKQAIAIIERSEGTTALALVELLRSLAESYRVQRVRHSEAERALNRALEIVESQEQVDFAEHVATLVELGDYHTVHRDYAEADEHYRHAWQLLEAQGDDEALDRTFGRPQRLVYSAPFAVDLVRERTPDAEPPHVEFRFTVTEEGRIVDLEVVESTLPNSLTRDVIASLRLARYRPRYVGGVPVRTEGVRLRQSYPLQGATAKPTSAQRDPADETAVSSVRE